MNLDWPHTMRSWLGCVGALSEVGQTTHGLNLCVTIHAGNLVNEPLYVISLRTPFPKLFLHAFHALIVVYSNPNTHQ